MTKAAVVGAGFGGLALCWHLLEQGIEVDLYDKTGIGSEASGLASGLLHPYVGEDVKRSWRATQGMEEAKNLLQIAQQFSIEQVADYKGILRKTSIEEVTHTMRRYSIEYGDVEQIEENLFLIRSGIIVNSSVYMKGLYRACQSQGVQLRQQLVEDFHSLKDYDMTFFTVGAGILTFPKIECLKINFVKGQVLECLWPSYLPPLDRALMDKGHIVPTGKGIVQLGATYEREELDLDPCQEKALADLYPKAQALIPAWKTIAVRECRAGVRVSRMGHYFPVMKAVADKVWVLTAFGSRGLLYHGYTAKILVEAAMRGIDPNLILFKNKPFSYDR